MYDEKQKILMYLQNEGFRRSAELETAKGSYYTHKSSVACMALLRAHIASVTSLRAK